jgi:hypothetical protein
MVALRPGVAEAGSESGRGTGVPHAGGASVWAEHAEGARVQARELDSPPRVLQFARSGLRREELGSTATSPRMLRNDLAARACFDWLSEL